jgi:hypothetical protein
MGDVCMECLSQLLEEVGEAAEADGEREAFLPLLEVRSV